MMEESHDILHGLKVGYGIMVQLVVQNCPKKEFDDALSFFRKLGLQPSLRGLKLPYDPAMVLRVAEKAANDPDIGPVNFKVSKQIIAAAMHKLERRLA
jgi:glycerol dehydrogenase